MFFFLQYYLPSFYYLVTNKNSFIAHLYLNKDIIKPYYLIIADKEKVT
ncbi:hypothetical protein TH70_0297 [Streptococcus agalactiae]|nr:hypothetical protein TH70_0297 [Streptococcus agalactiae]